MADFLSPLGYQLGVGGIGGFVVGYAIKKISKLLVILLGLFVIILIYLGTSGIISINYGELYNALARLLGFAENAASWLVSLMSLLPFMGSFLAGFFIGFKIG